MLPLPEHRYVAEILREGVAPITTGELRLDWIPALEWAQLQRLRQQASAPSALPQDARICPGWDHAAGAPYVSHVGVHLAEAPAGEAVIPLQYFAGAVQRAVTGLVTQGQVNDGDAYHWRICAYPATQVEARKPVDEVFEVEQTASRATLPQLDAVSALLARARHHGPGEAGSDDLPVLVTPQVLREAQASAVAAGTLEAGGVLLGQLARDAESGDLVLQVSAQVPALEAIADDASLRFTADTWQAVDAAIRLRHAGEQILGWWHSHPAALWMCRKCPPERRAACPSNGAFFSTADVGFHRTAFQSAHQVALLLSFMDDPAPRFDLFGWRRGLVCARGYHTLEEGS